MSTIDYAKAQAEANRLHAKAKDGAAAVDGVRYALRFVDGCYEASGPDGAVIFRFNTRKITVARKWLREQLA